MGGPDIPAPEKNMCVYASMGTFMNSSYIYKFFVT